MRLYFWPCVVGRLAENLISMPRAPLQPTSLNAFTPPGVAEPLTDNLRGGHLTGLVGEKEELAEDFLEIAFLLRHFSETSGQW